MSDAKTYPVICHRCRTGMVRHGWHLVCEGCGEGIEWAFGPSKREPVIARVGTERVLIGYISVPDLDARQLAKGLH